MSVELPLSSVDQTYSMSVNQSRYYTPYINLDYLDITYPESVVCQDALNILSCDILFYPFDYPSLTNGYKSFGNVF